MSEQTVKCPICGEPYVTYMYYAGDQSACPSCRAKARSNGFYLPDNMQGQLQRQCWDEYLKEIYGHKVACGEPPTIITSEFE